MARNGNKSTEELFREKIALRQCLWTYWLQVKQGKKMTDEDRELVKDMFIANAEFAEGAFEEEEKEKKKNSDLLHLLRDEAMEILNARSIKQLRKIKEKLQHQGYPDVQWKYLKRLIIKRKERLETD